MNRRELFRRTAGIAFAVAANHEAARAFSAYRKFPQNYDASEELASEDWRPRFLSAHQDRTLTVFADLLIPETETGGAKEALANRFIDLVLAHEESSVQEDFLRSLAVLDTQSREFFEDAFVYLDVADQNEVLIFLAYPHRHVTWGGNVSDFVGHGHFLNLKEWVANAFYTSEIGLKELGWDESPFDGDFVGCAHSPETHGGE